MSNHLSPKMKAALRFLGEPYRAVPIDLEMCIYRNLGNGFDIEVSGVNHPKRGYVCNFIQVWDVSVGFNGRAKPVERFGPKRALGELKEALDRICSLYS